MTKRWLAFLVFVGSFAASLAQLSVQPAYAARDALSNARHKGAFDEGAPTIDARLIAQQDPDGSVRVGVAIEIAPGWHIYWKNPGDSGLPTEVALSVEGAGSDAIGIGPIQWPTPSRFSDGDEGLHTYGYERRVFLHGVAEMPAGTTEWGHLRAEVDLVVCRDACIPDRFELDGAMADLIAQDTEWQRGLVAETLASLPRRVADAGLRSEPWMSRDGVRPAERIELGLGVFSTSDEALEATASVFFAEKLSGIKLEDIRILQHPADERALWVTMTALTASKPTVRNDEVRGVLRLNAKSSVHVTLPIRRVAPEAVTKAIVPPWQPAADEGEKSASWAFMLLFAFVGGLILNLMPCVLPILALKSFAVVELAAARRRDSIAQGVGYAAGIFTSMLLLALAVVALREAGTAVGWGFQLQEPIFLLGVSALLVLFALNLFGVFEIGAPGGLAEVGADSSGAARSFFEGFLAVALATPCSAPFLGTAVGFAFTTSNFATISVFLMVGVGLAAPFVAVSAAPNLSRFLPRPGPWMVHLRTFLGFCLLGSVVWLLWVLGQVTAGETATQALVWLLVLAVCAWLYGLGQQASGKLRPVLITVVVGALLAGPGLIQTAPNEESGVEGAAVAESDTDYSAERLAEGLDAGRPAFVYFTADWCVTCKVNERRVLKDSSVREALAAEGFDVFRADMTRRAPDLLATLKRYGRAGVPLYLVFRPGQAEPTVLPDLLSKDLVLGALRTGRTTTARVLPESL